MTITGGNVKAIAGKNAKSIFQGKYGGDGFLKDAQGNDLVLHTIAIAGAAEGTQIDAIAGVSYGIGGVKTVDTNKVYLYLPENAIPTSITAGGRTYSFTCIKDNYYGTDHIYQNGKCTGCGIICEHPDWKTADCDHPKTCTTCGMTAGGALSHSYANGFCDRGCYQPAECVNGTYQILNGGNLFWFAALVNSNDPGFVSSQKAIVINDIDLENREWISIGSESVRYGGNFDGNGKTITGFKQTITAPGDYGLFGYITGATVKDFTISGEAETTAAADGSNFGVVGYAAAVNSECNIYGIHSAINFTVGGSYNNTTAGGIVGEVSSEYSSAGWNKMEHLPLLLQRHHRSWQLRMRLYRRYPGLCGLQ